MYFKSTFDMDFRLSKSFFNIVASEMDTSIATWQMAWKFNYKCIKKHLFVENGKAHIDRKKKKCCQKKWKLIDQTIELCMRMCVEFHVFLEMFNFNSIYQTIAHWFNGMP